MKSSSCSSENPRYKDDTILEYKTNHAGWIVLASNAIRDKVTALEVYRQKDVVEKCFDDIKNELDTKRIRVHSVPSMEGRLFIQFVALILRTSIKEVMRINDWFRNHSVRDVIDEMKSLREVKAEGVRRKMRTQPTAFQKEIATLFGFIL